MPVVRTAMLVLAVVTSAAYVAYTLDPHTQEFFDHKPLVYSAPFVVKLPLSLDAKVVKGSKSGDVLIRGKVSYQACDDRVCFPPQSAPFEARLTVRPRRS